MQSLLVVLGFLLLFLTLIDILITALTLGGGGPLTSRLSFWLWKLVLKIHHWKPNHQLLAITSWLMLASIAVIWFLLSWTGWALLFSSAPDAVINAQTMRPANILERIYFTGYTLSTLGLGDYQPFQPLWQIATAIASTNGFFIVSLSISYLLPAVSAATRKRQLAVYIAALGGTSDEILTRAWNGNDFGQLYQHLITLTPMIAGMGESHLTYPILHYFHSVERSRAFILSLVSLDEALTLLHYGVRPASQPDATAVNTTRRTIAAFLETIGSAYIEPASNDPPLPPLSLLQSAGIPTVDDEEFRAAVQQITKRRKLLLALVQNDGWTWDSVASTKTTNRASTLDDETISTWA